MSAGPRRRGGRWRVRRGGAGSRRHGRGRVRLTRIRVVVVLTAVLGLAGIFFEDVVLFLATTRGGLPAGLSSPAVAIGVPLAIAGLLLVVLVGGALWADESPEQAATVRTGAGETGGDPGADDSDETDTGRSQGHGGSPSRCGSRDDRGDAP